MFFLGNTFCRGLNSATITPSSISKITLIELKNCIVDALYVTKSLNELPSATLPPVSAWNFDTILNAQFEGNLLGGNTNFTADQVSLIRIKRASIDTNDWITLFEIPINKNEDLDFQRIDRTAAGDTDYKYAFVPLWNEHIEGNYNINTIKSEFDGIWLVDKEISINAFLNLKVSTERNFITSTVVPLGRKFPFVNKYGLTNYVIGTFDVTFMSFNSDTCEFDFNGAVKYRRMIEERLTNEQPLLIKHWDGRSWIAAISDTIPKDESDHPQMPIQTISFTQIGDANSAADLYDNNIIDCDVERGIS